jgi:hypothetical protein
MSLSLQRECKSRSYGTVKARANYVVLQVLLDRPDATLHQVGVYYDVFRHVGGRAQACRAPVRLR